MEELKPVAWMWEHFGTHVTTNKKNAIDLEKFGVNLTPLYAIPYGYVVVPVDEIKKAVEAGFMSSGQGYNGEHCGAFNPEYEALEIANKYIQAMKDATFQRGSVVDEEV